MTAFDLDGHRLEPVTAVLEASAGTGKTFSLTALVIRLLVEGLTDGVHPALDGILLVTFTNKATDELRQRLRQRLALARRLWAVQVPDDALMAEARADGFLARYHARRLAHLADDARRLAAAEAVVDQAPISTIHGFCLRVLSQFAGLIGLPPDIAIATDEEERRLASCRVAWRALVSSEDDPTIVRLLLEPGAPGGGEPLTFSALDGDYRSWVGSDRPAILADGDPAELLASWPSLTPSEARAQAHRRWQAARLTGDASRLRGAARRLLLHLVDERLAAGCSQDGVITMDGVLVQLRAALRDARRGAALTTALQARYQAALIDEFQDTDPVQAEILTSLFHGGFLRCIGDPKQSIYRFRGADLHAYLAFVDSAVEPGQRQHMTANHRSAPGCVAVINHLFRDQRQPFIHPGIAYTEVRAARDAGCLDDGSPRHLVWWWLEAGRKADAERLLTAAVASEVHRLLAEARLTRPGGPGRAASAAFAPRHAAVLTATNRQAVAVADALRAAGIPAVNRSLESVFASEAAGEFALILASLADPHDGALARAALCTRLWGAGEELLAGSAGDLGAELAQLRALARAWHQLGVLGVVSRIVRQRSTRARLLGEAGGERYLTDLSHVAELVHAQGERPAVALAFLRAERRDQVAAEAACLRLEDDGDAVQVMTVHAAKGLEWPVVFAPFLWCTPRRSSLFVSLRDGTVAAARPIPQHTAHGWTWDWRTEVDATTAQAADADSRAEAVRQVYVALTRAAERTYVAWGPLGAKGLDAARSGLSLIAGVAPADCPEPQSFTQARATREWLCPPVPSPATLAAAQLLLAHSAGMAKAQLCAAGIAERDWATVRDELRSFGWATLRGRTYLATGAALDDYPRPPTLASARTSLGTVPAPGIQVVVAPPPGIARSPLPQGRQPLSSQPALAAVRPAWSITSFTGLTRGSEQQELLGALGDELPEAADDAQASGIHAFPAGAGPGDCLHRIIERADLRAPDAPGTRALISNLLSSERIAPEHEAVVVGLLGELAHTRVPGTGTRLADLPSASMRHEWSFDLAIAAEHGLDGVAAVFRNHADQLLTQAWASRMQSLRSHDLAGFLTGRADLIACIEGRWWVIDWKSNRLGPTRDAYGSQALLDNAIEHAYPLQWMLYLIALHRHLGNRLPEYAPHRHLGGAAYCYLRGLSHDHPSSGWLVHRPSPACITALDECLGGHHAGSRP